MTSLFSNWADSHTEIDVMIRQAAVFQSEKNKKKHTNPDKKFMNKILKRVGRDKRKKNGRVPNSSCRTKLPKQEQDQSKQTEQIN